MPKRKVHQQISSVVGAITAGVHSYFTDEDALKAIICALGGSLGGRLVAGLADVIDPATSPNHRGMGHAVLPNGVVITVGWEAALEVIGWLDERARRFTDEGSLTSIMLEIACYLARGMVVGALGGHLAHIAADACSAKGLPLICGKVGRVGHVGQIGQVGR